MKYCYYLKLAVCIYVDFQQTDIFGFILLFYIYILHSSIHSTCCNKYFHINSLGCFEKFQVLFGLWLLKIANTGENTVIEGRCMSVTYISPNFPDFLCVYFSIQWCIINGNLLKKRKKGLPLIKSRTWLKIRIWNSMSQPQSSKLKLHIKNDSLLKISPMYIEYCGVEQIIGGGSFYHI